MGVIAVRIALLADIHGNLAALEAVVADIGRRGVDQVVNLGDSLAGPLLPRETAQFIIELGWLSIAGDHERRMLTCGPGRRGASDEYAHAQLTEAELAWVRSLPPTARLPVGMFLCHGTPAGDGDYLLETVEDASVRPATAGEVAGRLRGVRSRLVACGHSHTARVVHAGAGRLLVNPGSVGLPAYHDVLPEPHVVETGSPDARYAIVEKSRDGWIVTLLSVPYRHKSMARLARIRGRADWEQALLTGYVT